jgi:ribosome-interacting GTPase 1
VIDFAASVHKDFVTGLKSARIWGSPLSAVPSSGSAKHPGQPVERDHPLADGDVVELHR